MKTLVLSAEDIRRIVSHVGLDALMDTMIARLTQAFSSFDSHKVFTPARHGFSYQQPHTGLLEWMPTLESGRHATIKVVGYHPHNPALNRLPTILSTASVYDVSSGHLVGIADATFLTALRTGAASAVASKILALPKSRSLGMIGAGAQAVTQAHALSRIFDLREVWTFDVNSAVSHTLPRRAAQAGLPIDVIGPETLAARLASTDIVCTATTVDVGAGPVLADGDFKPGVHFNAVGSDFPGKFELPATLLQRSLVCPDFGAQARKEGECQQIPASDIGPELVDLVKHPEKYHDARDRSTVFDSTGWAYEDHLAMKMLADYAADLGLGTHIELESVGTDPLDPYHFAANNFTDDHATNNLKQVTPPTEHNPVLAQPHSESTL
jgi:ornithine cyclodeaminase/alanine dehydrogenase-like protein (mu-crystallin family)